MCLTRGILATSLLASSGGYSKYCVMRRHCYDNAGLPTGVGFQLCASAAAGMVTKLQLPNGIPMEDPCVDPASMQPAPNLPTQGLMRVVSVQLGPPSIAQAPLAALEAGLGTLLNTAAGALFVIGSYTILAGMYNSFAPQCVLLGQHVRTLNFWGSASYLLVSCMACTRQKLQYLPLHGCLASALSR